jgi:hypothetical protein
MAGILEKEMLASAAQYLLQPGLNVLGAFRGNTGCRAAFFDVT